MKKNKVLSLIFLITWMAIILFLSSEPAEVSSQRSRELKTSIYPIIENVQERLNIKVFTEDNINFYLRKSAHFYFYFVLGIFLILSLRAYGLVGWKAYSFAWILGTVFAVIDEIYQIFVPGRGGLLRDVLIDSIGVLLGVIIFGWALTGFKSQKGIFHKKS